MLKRTIAHDIVDALTTLEAMRPDLEHHINCVWLYVAAVGHEGAAAQELWCVAQTLDDDAFSRELALDIVGRLDEVENRRFEMR